MHEPARQNLLFHESPVGILVVDRTGHIRNVNPAGCADLARPLDRLLGSSVLDWVLAGDRERCEEGLRLALEGRTASWTARIVKGDGLPRLKEFRAVPLGKGGGVEGAVVFLQPYPPPDAERAENLQLQSLLENLPGHFVLVTDRGGRIRRASGLVRTHYRDSGSVLGLHLSEIVGKVREGEGSADDVLGVMVSGKPWSGVQWHRRADGGSFPVEIFASPHLDPRTGQVVGVLVAGRDLSSERRWKDRAEQLEALAQLGAFTGRVVTELAGRLDRLEGALRGTAAGEKDTAPGKGTGVGEAGRDGQGHGPPAQEDRGGNPAPWESELQGLRKLLASLADLGQGRHPRRTLLSLPERVHEAVRRFSSRMEALGLQPTVEVPPNLPPVFADARSLDRILEILLENALDALEGTPDRYLALSLTPLKEGVTLRVTNSGSTVQTDGVEEIFDPFYTTRGGKAGLGLAVARALARLQEGRMWAEIPGKGLLTLALELPKEARDRGKVFHPAALSLCRPRTVLVVDDDEAIRRSLRSFLEKVGYQVREAWSGRSALAQLTSARLPEIVLTDLRMADGSGYWFLDEMAKAFPKLVRRTVLITGDAEYERASELAARTGCPLVRKPFELPHLLEVLDQVAVRN